MTQKQMELVNTTYLGHRMGIPVMLMLYAGLRRGGLMALTWNDVNFVEKTLRINKAVQIDGNRTSTKPPKSEAGNRTVPIPNVLIKSLQEAKRYARRQCSSAPRHPIR